MLNRRRELMNKCLHKEPYKLSYFYSHHLPLAQLVGQDVHHEGPVQMVQLDVRPVQVVDQDVQPVQVVIKMFNFLWWIMKKFSWSSKMSGQIRWWTKISSFL